MRYYAHSKVPLDTHLHCTDCCRSSKAPAFDLHKSNLTKRNENGNLKIQCRGFKDDVFFLLTQVYKKKTKKNWTISEAEKGK